MTAIMLTRVDDQHNVARFYKLDVQPTLFGGWSFVREWGRIGHAGRVCWEQYETRGMADIAMIAKWSEKRKRGYQ
ncbi:WGR domain-containing protein (plasmid) [Bradyrhizobium sp. 155]|uniref:WGR domain-containing protein n=1 Tax=Bradyrhizobium sp. 155 TaxID=2782629 RepID=UPI001FFFBF39|nr:WGR domain-containing protein [Bradyrhizobium sp. 155]UPK15956.1 WGR domain-containing protein [Bradyrhizobium sp. 155]